MNGSLLCSRCVGSTGHSSTASDSCHAFLQTIWLIVCSEFPEQRGAVTDQFFEVAAQLRQWRGQVHIVSNTVDVRRLARECNEACPVKFVPSCDRLELTASPERLAELYTVLREIFAPDNRVVDNSASLAGNVPPDVSGVLVHLCDQVHSQFVRQNFLSYLAGTQESDLFSMCPDIAKS